MKKLCLIFLFLIISGPAYKLAAQNLDSLYNEFIRVIVEPRTQQDRPASVADTTHIKCAFGLVNEIKLNIDRFSSEKQALLKTYLDRPVTDTSIISPSGIFRIHFNKSGYDVPKYSIAEAAAAFDSVYKFEVNYLGFPAPPSDDGAGGDDKFDVYILNLGRLYGQTTFEKDIGGGHYSSYIEIDNDFTGFYTSGINAARVTAAHEFHHAIQGGNYIYRDEDLFFYELTSTSMEEFVFDSVNDYYGYLREYFNNPDHSFAAVSGYSLAVWNIFLKDEFDIGIIKRQWDLMPQMRALSAINQSILENGKSFGDEFNKFGIWCYFTNYRAVPNKYFSEGRNYPLIKPVTSFPLEFTPPEKSVILQSKPMANNYVVFYNPSNFDTLVTIVTNSDYKSGIENLSSVFPFNYSLSDNEGNGNTKIADGYFQKFSANQISFWSTSEILNNLSVREGLISIANINYAYPSPFKYSSNSFVFIPVTPNRSLTADLNIYTSGMKLVYSSEKNIDYLYGQKVIRWNGKNENGEKLASGVYIYVAKSGDNISKGKLVIFNE